MTQNQKIRTGSLWFETLKRGGGGIKPINKMDLIIYFIFLFYFISNFLFLVAH
jgi:hypothetical protein